MKLIAETPPCEAGGGTKGKALLPQKPSKVSEAYALFGIGKDTIYRLIRSGAISSVNAGTKMTRVSNEELAKMFPLRSEQIKKQKPTPKLYSLEPEDCYTINEMCEKYHMNDK